MGAGREEKGGEELGGGFHGGAFEGYLCSMEIGR